MVWDAEKRGVLKPGKELIEPTSGNTGHRAGLRGRRARLSDHADDARDHVDGAPQSAEGAGRQAGPDRRRRGHGRLHRQGRGDGGVRPRSATCCCSSSRTPPIRRSTSSTTGPEIWEDTDGTIDVLVSGIGTGGTISGVSRYIKKDRGKKILSVGVEPQNSPVITQTSGRQADCARAAQDSGHRRRIHSGHAGPVDGGSGGTGDQ